MARASTKAAPAAEAAAAAPAAEEPQLTLRVRSPHGVRYRAGMRFDPQAQTVQVSAGVAAILRADPLLDVSEAGEG
jgi:hypothetical protein